MLTITPAETPAHYQLALELMAEYVAWDSAQVRAQGLDAEKFLTFYYGGDRRGGEDLPGPFAPPAGCLLLATDGAEAVGCVAFRRLSADTCEMKRLFVRPRFHGRGAGRLLAETLIATARDVGYSRMLLDTTTFMQPAVALYKSLGFGPGTPYHAIPPGFEAVTVFMELDLTSSP
jgi:GNAT superfamily N-acetyltransferase